MTPCEADGNNTVTPNVQVDMRTMAILPVVVVLLSGCGSTATPPAPPAASSSGRVIGTVLAGPRCPVERIGDVNCAPIPVAGVVELTQGDLVVASARLDVGGAFSVRVAPGSYSLIIETGEKPFPRCEPVEVIVVDAADTVANVVCDTGIR